MGARTTKLLRLRLPRVRKRGALDKSQLFRCEAISARQSFGCLTWRRTLMAQRLSKLSIRIRWPRGLRPHESQPQGMNLVSRIQLQGPNSRSSFVCKHRVFLSWAMRRLCRQLSTTTRTSRWTSRQQWRLRVSVSPEWWLTENRLPIMDWQLKWSLTARLELIGMCTSRTRARRRSKSRPAATNMPTRWRRLTTSSNTASRSSFRGRARCAAIVFRWSSIFRKREKRSRQHWRFRSRRAWRLRCSMRCRTWSTIHTAVPSRRWAGFCPRWSLPRRCAISV